MWLRTILKAIVPFILLNVSTIPSLHAYSVLTHLAIIDVTWDNTLKPLLREKYHGLTDSQLLEAHAYAYGGSIAPDMGYFPFGSKLFTNLLHYVRSGDFVTALLEEARNADEYAFALGALAHYNADNYGHPLGTNRCTPLIFPRDKRKFGDTVTYFQDPVGHVRTEFSFDVIQTARGDYASLAYHDFIGFQVSEGLLRRAFLKVYDLDIDALFPNFQRSVNTFRWSVKELFPVLTRTAWASKTFRIQRTVKDRRRHTYIYRMKQNEFRRQFGNERDRPGFAANALGMIVRIVPKIGPLKKLKIIVPGPEAQRIFISSFDTVVVHYKIAVAQLQRGAPKLPDRDYDTGKETEAGEYGLADASYDELLLHLEKDNFKGVSNNLRNNIMHYYARASLTNTTTSGNKKYADVASALLKLKALR